MKSTNARSAISSGDLASIVSDVAHLLPAQGPLNVFIHHNTLHAFEDLAFEDAVVVEAARKFGCEPFLPEQSYRDEFAHGRITDGDLREILAEDAGERGDRRVANLVPWSELAFTVIRHGIPRLKGAELRWH